MKIIWFARGVQDNMPGEPVLDTNHEIDRLTITELEGDEDRSILRQKANSIFGAEGKKWRFLPDANERHDRLNSTDAGTGRPAKYVAYELDHEGRPNLGNYIAIRHWR